MKLLVDKLVAFLLSCEAGVNHDSSAYTFGDRVGNRCGNIYFKVGDVTEGSGDLLAVEAGGFLVGAVGIGVNAGTTSEANFGVLEFYGASSFIDGDGESAGGVAN
jgi:hypothetical protein